MGWKVLTPMIWAYVTMLISYPYICLVDLNWFAELNILLNSISHVSNLSLHEELCQLFAKFEVLQNDTTPQCPKNKELRITILNQHCVFTLSINWNLIDIMTNVISHDHTLICLKLGKWFSLYIIGISIAFLCLLNF